MTRKLAGGRLVLASHNKGKLAEIAELVAPFGIEALSAASFGLEEPAETEDSFAGNALIKARFSANATQLPALADDSGLEVTALGGEPGVYTADWAETPDGRDWMLAMHKVEDRLQALGPDMPRDACFVCTLALVWPGGEEALFEGRIAGHLVWPPRGENGFGYDPMFVPDGYDQTFGEMDPAQKHAISHRARAFAQLQAACLD
ncbi:MAG: RdgB/HAM1 family non-canonical purine NTP pyrophosphatase [Sphingomonadaceae bacterium]